MSPRYSTALETRIPMPRYFQSHVVGRPLQAGDRSFIFEPMEPMGGSWLGVLAVDDESAASILAMSDGAWEITAEQFDALKKKRAGVATAQGYVPSRTPPLPRQPLAAAASRAALPSTSASEAEPIAGVAKPLASITLLVTDKKPPAEPLLEDAATGKRRKAA